MWPASPQDKDGLRARCIRTRAVARTATATLDRADSAISRQSGTAAESANKARYGPCGRAARASTRRSSRYRAPPSDHGHRAPARWWQTRLPAGRHITTAMARNSWARYQTMALATSQRARREAGCRSWRDCCRRAHRAARYAVAASATHRRRNSVRRSDAVRDHHRVARTLRLANRRSPAPRVRRRAQQLPPRARPHEVIDRGSGRAWFSSPRPFIGSLIAWCHPLVPG